MHVPTQSAPEPPSGKISDWIRGLVGLPLALWGSFVTTLFGVFLGAYFLARIGGELPAPQTFVFLVVWVIFGAAPLALGLSVMRVAPKQKRITWRVLLGVFLLFLVAGADGNLGPNNWRRIFWREKLPATDVSTLKQTMVSPILEADITKGTNLLWCGTFQLAWNEACRLTGGDLRFSNEPPIISVLNKHSFTKESLDESSYVAFAGFAGNNIHDSIRKAVDEKFHGRFNPRMIPDKALTPRPQDIVAYACLYKNLSFPMPFERLDETLTFAETRVSAFGFGPYKPSLEKIYPQVLILDYQGEDDFVIELKTKSDGDRLILAKVKPDLLLSETVGTVTKRMVRGPAEAAATNDLLLVPRIKLDLNREYSEIERLHLVPKGANVAKDLVLLSAAQNTVFEMNEKGVELKSEAHMAFGCAAEEEPVPKHKMIFDKPFLILMQRREARVPYFALWVDNPEVLISWK